MQVPERLGSVVARHGLSCSSTCGILVPKPGIKLASPALQGRFLITGPPGKFYVGFLIHEQDLSFHLFKPFLFLSLVFRSSQHTSPIRIWLDLYPSISNQVAQVVKNLPTNTGGTGVADSIPGLGRSPGEGNGNPLKYPCQENPMDRESWQTTVNGITKSWT